MVGKIISHYKILEKLGSGGMGVVYKAEDVKLKRRIALKFLPLAFSSDPEAKERFINEAQAASALDHPNICNIHEIGETNEGSLFIAMAYYEGETLKLKINNYTLAIEESIDIAIQVARGLAQAHHQGIIHRDIKPANIMITSDGTAKIVDFGLAKVSNVDFTRSHSTLGTIAYMSYEQVRGKPVDHRADIWSLGVVLYEMLTGQRPFKGEVEQTVIYSILNETPQPLRNLRPEAPPGLEQVVNKALTKNLEDRYADMEEMLQDLSSLSEKMTPVDWYSAMDGRRRKRASKSRSAKNIVIAILMVLSITAGAVYYFLPERSGRLNPNRVMVAVFENRTGDHSLDRMGNMAADWITQGLTYTGMVELVPSTTVLRATQYLKSRAEAPSETIDLQALAEETGAGIVVSGSYYKQAERLQFQTQIIDMPREKLLWAVEPVSGSLENSMEAIERLRQEVMAALASHFNPMLSSWADKASRPPTFEAYQAYIAGLEAAQRSNHRKALQYFEKAAATDTLFASALLRAAIAHINLWQYGRADSIITILEQSYEQLAPLDRYWSDWVRAELRGDRAGTLRAIRLAAEAAPTPENLYGVGRDALRFNRPAECVKVFAKIDAERGYYKERYAYWEVLTAAYHMLGEFHGELKTARRARRLHPDLRRMMNYEARALIALGEVEEAMRLSDQAQTLPDQPSWPQIRMLRAMGVFLRAHGHRDESLKILDRAINWYRSRPSEKAATRSHRYHLAQTLYQAERWQEARALFEQLVQEDSGYFNFDYRGYLGVIAARQGQADKARLIAGQLQQLKKPYLIGQHTFWCGAIAAQLGEREHAVELLREAFAQGYWYGPHVNHSIDLEPLWDYSPYQELIRPKG